MKTFEEAKQYISETCHEHIKTPFEIRYNFKDTAYLGRCRMSAVPQITFNVPYIKYCLEHNEVENFKQTVLHEIGHVLAGAKHGHDNVWKEKCKSIGLENPQRCNSTTYRRPNKYKLTCPHCGLVTYQAGKPRKGSACRKCCKEYNNGKWHPNYIFEVEKLEH